MRQANQAALGQTARSVWASHSLLLAALLGGAQVWYCLRLTITANESFLDPICHLISSSPRNCTVPPPGSSLLPSSMATHSFSPLPPLEKNESFGACLLIKGDNDLLSEWIPYHFTILPLRYVLVASDVGNSEDPNDVLQRWTHANTGLESWVVNASVFETLHGGAFQDVQRPTRNQRGAARKENEGSSPSSEVPPASPSTFNQSDDERAAHHHLMHKQSQFITYCTNFMRQRGVRWVTFHDTDEFLVVNRIGPDEQEEGRAAAEPDPAGGGNPLSGPGVGWRRHLPPIESDATVVDMIREFQHLRMPLNSCHSVPRVTAGAMETFTCPGAEPAANFAKEHFRFDLLNTLRFQQHALKGDFRMNRFGKVFMDVQIISDESLSTKPKNIHRPYGAECPRPVPNIRVSPFYLMHYVGSLERYLARDDGRRSLENWKNRGYVNDSTACCAQEIHRWLPRFVTRVGLDRAKFLLAGTTAAASGPTRTSSS